MVNGETENVKSARGCHWLAFPHNMRIEDAIIVGFKLHHIQPVNKTLKRGE